MVLAMPRLRSLTSALAGKPLRPLAVAAGLALAIGAAAQPASPEPTRPRQQRARAAEEPYLELIEVVETSVLVETDRRPDPEELLLLEGGIAREAVRVERLPDDEPWDLLVWIDGPLCEQAPLSSTLLGLAHRSRDLTRLGRVRVLVADDASTTEVIATREAPLLESALAQLSARELCTDAGAALFWEARETGTAAAGEAALRRLRELVASRARLLIGATGPCRAGACAVLTITHGYPLHPDLWLPPAMRPASAAALAEGLAAETTALARQLAVSRWLFVGLPFAPPPSGDDADDDAVPREARPGPEAFPRRADDPPPPAWRVWPPPSRATRRAAVQGTLRAAEWDLYTLPELAPLRQLADATAGLVLRVPEQLPGALDVLGTRWRVWYRTTPFAAGEARTLEVLVGDPPQPTAAPAWVGIATATTTPATGGAPSGDAPQQPPPTPPR
jgi:hypothetical protein